MNIENWIKWFPIIKKLGNVDEIKIIQMDKVEEKYEK